MQAQRKQLYLASASPRRKALLKVFFPYLKVYIPRVAEKKAPRTLKSEKKSAQQIVLSIAEAKAEAAFHQLVRKHKQAAFSLIAADTLVFHGKRVLGKPKSKAEAKAILQSLSGRTHYVYTAVSIWSRQSGYTIRKSIAIKSQVRFRRLSPSLIDWYIATGEPMDKAGAYGAQERGAVLIADIRGSYTNVVGLPVAETLELLSQVLHYPWTESSKT